MYTGYGQFFGQESNQCDGVTWVRSSYDLNLMAEADLTDLPGVLV